MNLHSQISGMLAALGATAGERYLVALSGGVDSVALLHAFHKAGIIVQAAHVNYGLRGDESEADEQFVKSFCGSRNVECHVLKAHELLNKYPHGVQAEARAIRYNWFGELLEEHNLDWIITAHHLNDNIETHLMHLARGAGLRGLASIPRKNNRILRPLLKTTRVEIEVYAKSEALTWRHDSSNDSPIYLRNQVRRYLMPAFENLSDRALHNAGASIEFLSQADDYLVHSALQFLSQHFKSAGEGLHVIDYKDAAYLFQFPTLGVYVLQCLGFDPGQLPLLKALSENQSGRELRGPIYTVYSDRDRFVFRESATRILEGIELPAGRGEVQHPIHLSWSTLPLPENFKKAGNNAAWLDLTKLSQPLLLRPWLPGDRFVPLGMKGSKKLSDFFTDLKVPRPAKDAVYVLCSGGEVVWVAGYRISENHKAQRIGEPALHLELHAKHTLP